MLRALIACTGCVSLGVFAGMRLIRRTNELDAWLQAFELMRLQCACQRNTPAEILRSGARYVSALADAAQPDGQAAVLAAVRQAPEDIKELLQEGVRAVLDGGQREQEMRLAFVTARLEEVRVRTQAKCDRDARLYVMLGIWSGLCALLIF